MPVKEVHDLSGWSALMKDPASGPKVIAFCQKSHNDDLLKFFTSMKAGKKGQGEYDLYIKPGAKYEMNIDSALRTKFTEIAAEKPKPDWTKAPWDKATQEVIALFNSNVARKVP